MNQTTVRGTSQRPATQDGRASGSAAGNGVKRPVPTRAIAAGVLGVILLGIGLVVNNQANFSRNYVHDQLAEHKIVFTPVAGLNAAQKDVPCLLANAGKQLTTGKQAECYAKYQIGLDLPLIDNGKGYAEDHYAAYLLRLKVAEAVKSKPNDPATIALVQQSTELTRKADDLLAGESMKGLLLSAYGFSIIGDRAGQAASTCFVVAGALLLAMLAGLALGYRRR